MSFDLPPSLPDRIWIIGPSGAGKSTFAQSLADACDLPLIHFDQYYWKPGWEIPSREEWYPIAAKLAEGERWIIEGNYSSTAAARQDRAQLVVHLDLPRWRYVWRVVKRIFQTYGVVRSDMAEGCPEKVDFEFMRYVWNFPYHMRPRLLGWMAGLRDDQWGVTVTHPKEVAALLDQLCKLPQNRAQNRD